MARHAEILQEFKERSIKFDSSSSKDLTSLKLILIKACDVSNELRPTDVSELWVERLMQEYFQQVGIIFILYILFIQLSLIFFMYLILFTSSITTG